MKHSLNAYAKEDEKGIASQARKDEDGRRRGIPAENLIVDNCKVFNGHGGFVVGSEMSGGVRNVMVRNCEFLGTDVGLRFKSARGRGGLVENIFVEKISMFDIATESLLFDLYYGGKSAVEMLEEDQIVPRETIVPEVTEETPAFRNIFIKNIISGNARRAMYFNGLPEMNISNIRIEDAFISSQIGAELSESKDVLFKNVTIIPKEGPALLLNNVKNMKVDEFSCSDLTTIVRMTGIQNDNIQLPASIKKEKIEIQSMN